MLARSEFTWINKYPSTMNTHVLIKHHLFFPGWTL
jgi:hypothetical protein